MAGGRRGGRGNVGKRRREEEEYIAKDSGGRTYADAMVQSGLHSDPDFASQAAYDDAINEHYTMNREFMRGFYPEDIRKHGPMKDSYLMDTYGHDGRKEEGMLSGAWENIKGFGKHLAQNNPISLRFQEVQAGVDAYDNYWLTRLGHEGTPLKEDYNNEDDFMIDYKKYWNERPLDYTWFKHYGD